jgi:type II secretory pathway pseudopilin PulG
MRAPQPSADDSGFTLVEAVVSLFVLGIIFTALAAAALGSLRASVSSRAEQQAIDFATEALEKARQAEYFGLAHDQADVVADSTRVSACGPTWCFDPGDGAEKLVIQPGGSLTPHVATVDSKVNNGTNFTVATYVTRPLQPGADVKRVTVVARWNVGGQQRERVTSSMLTATTRGLPVPLFAFETATNSQAVNPWTGNVADDIPAVAFKIQMTNQGAPDRWDLTTDGGTWTFWRDNGDSILCTVAALCGAGVVVDSQLVDTDDPGTAVDTGRLDPTTSITIWAVRQVPELGVASYWNNLTATAVSLNHAGVDPAAGAKTLALRTVVTNDVVSGQPGGGTPASTVPTEPRNLSLTIGNTQLTANWTPPENEGSSAILDYVFEYRLSNAATWTTESGTSTALSQVLSGLSNGLVYEVRVAARNAAGPGAYGTTIQGSPEGVTPYTTPAFCASTNPGLAPVAVPAAGFTAWKYSLHNRSVANPSWPGTGAPPPTRSDTQGIPLNMIKDEPALGLGTALPVYSADLSAEPGRVILPTVKAGGEILSGPTDSEYFVDWRTNVPGKQYSGTAVLTLWVAPTVATTSTDYQLSAQLYKSTATDTAMDSNENLKGMGTAGNSPSNPVTLPAAPWCGTAWQQVSIPVPISMSTALAAGESLGVRVWNSGTDSVRIGYDVAGDFPARIDLPEK